MWIFMVLQGLLVGCECAGGGEDVGAYSVGNDSFDCSSDLLKYDSNITSLSERNFSEFLIAVPTGLSRKCRSIAAFLDCMEEAAWSCEQADMFPDDKAIIKSGEFLRQLCIDYDSELKKSFLYSTACINKQKSRTDLSCKPEKIYKNVTAFYPSVKASCYYQKALLECRRKSIDKQYGGRDAFLPELENFFQLWTTSKTEKLTETCEEEDCSQSTEIPLEKGLHEMDFNDFRRYGFFQIRVPEELEEEFNAKLGKEFFNKLKAYHEALTEIEQFHKAEKGQPIPDVDTCDEEECGSRRSDSLYKKPDAYPTSNPTGANWEETCRDWDTLVNYLGTKVGSKFVVRNFFQLWTTSKTEKLMETCEDEGYCSQSREVPLEEGPPEMNLNDFRRYGTFPIRVPEELKEEFNTKLGEETLNRLKAYQAALAEFAQQIKAEKGQPIPDVDVCDEEECGSRRSDSLHKKPDGYQTSNPTGAYVEEIGTIVNDLETKVGSKFIVKPRRRETIDMFGFETCGSKEDCELKINYVLIGGPYVPL